MATTLTPYQEFSLGATNAIAVERWPTEKPLFVFAAIASVLLWIVLTISIVGILYAAFIGLFFFIGQVAFITHVRGNGVRLGPDQFPELYARVQEIGRRMGMTRVPDAYIMQAGGSLNAFATRFLRSHMVVLFTDLLEACGDDEDARDMIIGHELGHVHAGHLRWTWFLLPSLILPFLGSALSRAREYTCDRYGWAAAGNVDGALLGLAILAAGGRHGRLVNREALVRQRHDLDTGWMTIGQWFSTHPPLAERMVALDPALETEAGPSGSGPVRAILILAALILPLVAASWFGIRYFAGVAADAAAAQAETQPGGPVSDAGVAEDAYVAPADAARLLEQVVATTSAFLAAEVAAGRGLPANSVELGTRWEAATPGQPLPADPFDGLGLGYTRTETGYVLWSSGPDQAPGTGDDIEYRFEG